VIGSYDDGPPYYGLSILEFRDDKVAHETIYGRGGMGGARVAGAVAGRAVGEVRVACAGRA
jgi:hypothetical protein